jgi:hypothetical protein
MLQTTKDQLNVDLDELIGAAHVLGSRPNYLTLDENGFFHIQVSGTIEECIAAMKQHTEKLERISKQKKGQIDK